MKREWLEATNKPRLVLLSGLLLLLLLVCASSYADQPQATGTSPVVVPAGTSPTVAPVSTATPMTEWLFDTALAADALQSLRAQQMGLSETNSVLGAHPNQAQTVGYFVGAGVIHYLLTRELIRQHVPSSIVQMWETGTIGLEMAYVKHNASLGVHFYVP